MTQGGADQNPYRRYVSAERLKDILSFANKKETPFLVIDLPRVGALYDALAEALPSSTIYYALKACPLDEVVKILRVRGACFDVASVYEIEQLRRLNVPPSRMSFGNTIKKAKDVAYAYRSGIRHFATDSLNDVEMLGKCAQGASVTFRVLLPENRSADWPLSRKFGADGDTIFSLACRAREVGLVPYALSFHVGSQQRSVAEWDRALALTRTLYDRLARTGITIQALNLGGGFPATYCDAIPSVQRYARGIKASIKKHFKDEKLAVIVEPGRSIVGDAGILFSEVVLVSQKTQGGEKWVYVDVGKFGGLIETMDESIKYPLFILGKERERKKSRVVLAGPTCDSADILYEKFKYQLPESTQAGDRLLVMSAGAYTASYSSVNFNGIPPLKVHVLKK